MPEQQRAIGNNLQIIPASITNLVQWVPIKPTKLPDTGESCGNDRPVPVAGGQEHREGVGEFRISIWAIG